MPVTQSAKKALRRDKRRTLVNRRIRQKVKQVIRKLREEKTDQALSLVYSTLDRAAKKGVIHKNKASRLKSRLAKLVKKKAKTPKKTGSSTSKQAIRVKKTAKKSSKA